MGYATAHMISKQCSQHTRRWKAGDSNMRPQLSRATPARCPPVGSEGQLPPLRGVSSSGLESILRVV
jgi:hypothetical protein